MTNDNTITFKNQMSDTPTHYGGIQIVVGFALAVEKKWFKDLGG